MAMLGSTLPLLVPESLLVSSGFFGFGLLGISSSSESPKPARGSSSSKSAGNASR